VASATALIILAPVFLGIGAAVRLAMGRPILFRQRRPGRDGRPFIIYKFRTMRDVEQGDPPGGEGDEQRLTRLGIWLRRSSLDELPELWNVLKGEMSLVGPRPLLMEYCELYTAEQARRHEVRPGLTGWAQIHGRNDTSWEERLARDVWYVDHRDLWLDIRILLRTVVLVLGRKGVSATGHATMPRFRGTTDEERKT
jgi:lipopolysaccharide/colanic/teichoic acid biosynthesis glycosyltransferase